MVERETRRDIEAALAARRDLGPDYDDQIAAGLVEHIDELVAIRVAETRTDLTERQLDREDERTRRRQRFVLGIVSVGTGIPVTAIVTGTGGGLLELAVAWAGVVGVNLAASWHSSRT